MGHLLEVIGQLADGSLKGPEARLTDGRGVRYWPVTPYLIYHRRMSRRTAIVRIYHQARRSLEAGDNA